MNIAYIVSFNPYEPKTGGGGSINTGVIAKEMSRRGHEVTVFHAYSSSSQPKYLHGVRIVSSPSIKIPIASGLDANLRISSKILQELKQEHFDVIEVRGAGIGIPFILGSKHVNALIYHLMDVNSVEFSNLSIKGKFRGLPYYLPTIVLEKFVVSRAAWFIVDTVSVGESLQNVFPSTRGRWTVIPPAISAEWNDETSGEHDPFQFLFMGAKDRRDTGLFLRALKYANERGVAARGVILREERSSYLRLAQQLDVQVRFLEPVAESQLRSIYSSSCSFVLPSFREAICMPVIEAALHHTPSIVSHLETVEEFVKDEVNGIVIRDMEPETWGESLIRMATDNALRSRLGENAYLRALRYSQFEIGTATEELYKQLLDQNYAH